MELLMTLTIAKVFMLYSVLECSRFFLTNELTNLMYKNIKPNQSYYLSFLCNNGIQLQYF